MTTASTALPSLTNVRATRDPESLNAQLDAVKLRTKALKRKRPRALTEQQKVDILVCYHGLQQDALESQKKHLSRKVPAGRYRQRVVKLLGYSSTTVSKVYSEWLKKEEIKVAAPPANRLAKETLVPRTKAVLHAVRRFVRERRARKERVVSRNVWDFLREKGVDVLNVFCFAVAISFVLVRCVLLR